MELSSRASDDGCRSFALYARTSTEEHQSPADSLGWQMARAVELIEPHGGTIVSLYHDVGQSRIIPWARRPRASALLTDLEDPARSFGHIVVAEPARAFVGGEAHSVLAVLNHFDVGFWVPEINGMFQADSEAHGLMIALYSEFASAERNRMRIRVRTAMRQQASAGRWLGGRPPYGYRLVDVEPHPNPEKARAGIFIQALTVDDDQADIVRRIFEMYVAGDGYRSIAKTLDSEGVAAPGKADPLHQSRWAHTTIRAILTNSTYSGERAFGRTARKEQLIDPHTPALGVRRTQPTSARPPMMSSVEAIVDADTWERAQHQLAQNVGTRRPQRTARNEGFTGVLRCAVCGRTMTREVRRASVIYRCRRRGHAVTARGFHPPTISIAETRILDAITAEQRRLDHPAYRESLVETIQSSGSAQQHVLRSEIERLQDQLARLVTAIEGGFDPEPLRQRFNSLSNGIRQQQELLAEAVDSDPGPATARQVLDCLNSFRTHPPVTSPALSGSSALRYRRTEAEEEIAITLAGNGGPAITWTIEMTKK
ncbi:MAG TPA: recombinase family protein [Ilumatobacteraceae bacterium]|nr:recombinase family protein [Ilumatobacteraceae bacterium]